MIMYEKTNFEILEDILYVISILKTNSASSKEKMPLKLKRLLRVNKDV